MGFEPTTTTLATWYSTTELHPRIAYATGADYGNSFCCVKRPTLFASQDFPVFVILTDLSSVIVRVMGSFLPSLDPKLQLGIGSCQAPAWRAGEVFE